MPEKKISEKRRQEILKKINQVSDEEKYVTSWDEKGSPTIKSKEKISQGKKAKRKGGEFELKVRKDLESKGWIVTKWQNNVDLNDNKIVPAKRKYNPFAKVMTIGTGFPDFLAYQKVGENTFNVIGVESKINGTLSKEEKEKCAFLLKEKVFNNIWITNEIKRGPIEYIDFKEKFGKKFNLD